MKREISKTLLFQLSFLISILAYTTNLAHAATRPLKYYAVDRIVSNSEFATLATYNINSAVVAVSTNGSTSSWQSTYNAARAANINIIIWPLDPGGDNVCGWESPFNSPDNGDYISKIRTMLDWWANKPGVLGINTFHEPMWSTSKGCKDSVADLSAVYQQIHTYTNNPNFEVYGYINTLNTSTIRNGDGNGTGVIDYTGPADLAKIMDVAVIWQHCAGDVEGPCEGSNSAMSRINESRSILTNAQSHVKLLFLQQTFTTSGYSVKFTPDEFYKYSCDFLNTGALDGFAYYTWHTGWSNWPDLSTWSDLKAKLPTIYNDCVADTPVPVLGDADGDRDVDINDYSIWFNNYTKKISGASNGDFNSDEAVNGTDYTIWLLGFEK
jgi:hypothetical protein